MEITGKQLEELAATYAYTFINEDDFFDISKSALNLMYDTYKVGFIQGAIVIRKILNAGEHK